MDAFGNVLEKGNSGYLYEHSTDPQPHHLTTKEYDPDSRLYYFHARWYDPETGRFISADPHHGINRFDFCRANPVNLIDAAGLSARQSQRQAWQACPPTEHELAQEMSYPPSPRWCYDASWAVKLLHPGLRCYRDLRGGMCGYNQCCYKNGVLVEESPDVVSPAVGVKNDNFTCRYGFWRCLGHCLEAWASGVGGCYSEFTFCV